LATSGWHKKGARVVGEEGQHISMCLREREKEEEGERGRIQRINVVYMGVRICQS
jgi:hypothetical protein